MTVSDDLDTVREGLGLARSIVRSGEFATEQFESVTDGALAALDAIGSAWDALPYETEREMAAEVARLRAELAASAAPKSCPLCADSAGESQ